MEVLTTAPVADMQIDASGLNCPLPILRAKKALAQLTTGQILSVTTTDPHAKEDFQAFCQQTGNTLLFQDLFNEQSVIHYLRRR